LRFGCGGLVGFCGAFAEERKGHSS
jgi:hypothetical protein